MKDTFPIFSAADELPGALRSLSGADPDFDRVKNRMLGFQGEAARRYREEILRLLKK